MGEVVDITDMLLRRAVRLEPSCDPWADAIAETLMARWPDAPDSATEAFTTFVTNYAEQTDKTAPEQVNMDWLFDHFLRLSGMNDGAA